MSDGAKVVVVDRYDTPNLPYCVHGYSWCVTCKQKVALGERTVQVVMDRDDPAWPLCQQCAVDYARRGDITPDQLIGNVADPMHSGPPV